MKYFAAIIAVAIAASYATPGRSSTAEVDPIASPQVAAAIAQAQGGAEAEPLLSGTFEAAEHPTTGTVTIVEAGGQRYLELGDDFSTDPGPDLVVVLHQSNDFLSVTSPPAYGIEEGSYVSIAPLEQVNGAQRYLIPDSVDVAAYGSVAIWCRQFNATFGAANLSS